MQSAVRQGIVARLRLRGTRSFANFRRRLVEQQSGQQPPKPAPVKEPSAVERVESRLPRFLHRFTKPLRDAPVSHITAFLILHEITAIVPLFALAGFFHYSNWLPPYISEGAWVREGTERFGKWLRSRGWIDAVDDRKSRWYGRGESGVRLVAEFATAYAITKALLPLRLPFSVWLTPWFARWTTLPAKGLLKRIFRRKKTAPTGVPAQGVTKPPSSNASKNS